MTRTQQQTGPSTRSSSVDLVYIDPSGLSPDGWVKLAAYLAPALERQAEQTAETICQEIAKGEAQAWAVIDSGTEALVGALVSHIGQFPSGLKCLTVTLCATQDTDIAWESMRGVIATMEEFGREYGCDVIRIYGRRGWERVFRDFDLEHVCIQKTIGGSIQ